MTLDTSLGMRPFCVADLNAQGEVIRTADYSYEALEQLPGALDLIVEFSTAIWRNPDEFEAPLPHAHSHLQWRWRASAPTAGVATLRADQQLLSISLLATGLSPRADEVTLNTLQQHLLRELRDTGFEPAFDLTHLQQRPLLATLNLFDPPDSADLALAALADRCFAAAYFRRQNLA